MKTLHTSTRYRHTPGKAFAAAACMSLSLFLSCAWAQEPEAPVQEKVKFNTIDANGDNHISEHEMTTWRAAKFTARDLDQDGVITRGELLREATDGNRGLTWEETIDFFMAYDDNADLEISYQEVISSIERSGFFQIMDDDRSGGITRLEAAPWLDVSGAPEHDNHIEQVPGPYLNARPVPIETPADTPK